MNDPNIINKSHDVEVLQCWDNAIERINDRYLALQDAQNELEWYEQKGTKAQSLAQNHDLGDISQVNSVAKSLSRERVNSVFQKANTYIQSVIYNPKKTIAKTVIETNQMLIICKLEIKKLKTARMLKIILGIISVFAILILPHSLYVFLTPFLCALCVLIIVDYTKKNKK